MNPRKDAHDDAAGHGRHKIGIGGDDAGEHTGVVLS